MSFYAYCLLRLGSDEPWPVMSGISDHPVFPLRCGKYTMLLSRLGRDFSFSPRSIVEHGQVISHAFETHTVLPMRFATFFQSERQIENLIRENQKELLEAFCRLRGKAEMRLKLVFQGEQAETKNEKKPPQKISASSDAGIGGENGSLDIRQRELATHIAERVNRAFHPLEQQVFCRQLQNSELVVDCAHLIESQKVEHYQRAHSVLTDQVRDWDLRLSGPWPPYHFLPATVRMPAPAAIPLRRRVSIGSLVVAR